MRCGQSEPSDAVAAGSTFAQAAARGPPAVPEPLTAVASPAAHHQCQQHP